MMYHVHSRIHDIVVTHILNPCFLNGLTVCVYMDVYILDAWGHGMGWLQLRDLN